MKTTSDSAELSIVVTGGHSGIGLELTRRLAAAGHRIGLIVRSRSRIDALGADLRERVTIWEADLGVQAQVVRVAEQIIEQWGRVDVLFNNAGVLLGELRKSAQNNEMHLEINALAAYLLTRSLKPALDAADHPTVVNTATATMHSRALDLDAFVDPKYAGKLGGAYMQSKVVLTQLMNDLARAPGWERVQIRNVDPGPNRTSMTTNSGMPGWLLPLVAKFLFPKPARGANFVYQAAFAPEHRDASGVYLSGNRVKPMKHQIEPAQKEALLARYEVPLP
ncbi:MAG: SDR family NAD(P)-dependent oxidoreductase [Myxococcota bacterium]